MKNFNVLRDVNNDPTIARPPSDYILQRSVAANVAESITVPAGANICLFSSNINFHANATTTAAIGADITNGTASELNPTSWNVQGVTTISVISDSAGLIQAIFYA